jgi:hypothetical protein
MRQYRPTVNLPEGKRYEIIELPDSPRTAILVTSGFLIPVEGDLLDDLGDEDALGPLVGEDIMDPLVREPEASPRKDPEGASQSKRRPRDTR